MDLTGQERFLYSPIKMRSIVLFMFLYSKRLIDYSYKCVLLFIPSTCPEGPSSPATRMDNKTE
jgi:hypothetical protein